MNGNQFSAAREMILALNLPRLPISKIAKETGLTRTQVAWIAYKMRTRGDIVPAGLKVLIGERRDTGERVVFHGLAEAEANGFSSNCIKRTITGKQSHHAGYVWRYEWES